MIETQFRPKLQPLCDKIGAILLWYNCTPHMLTAYAFISGILSGLAVIYNYLHVALCLLLISGLCDVLDGTIARLSNNVRKIGAYLDLISDRMVESALMLGFAIAYPQHALLYIFFFIGLLFHFSSFVVAGALFENMSTKSMHYESCLIERGEAFIVFCAMLLMPSYIDIFLTALNIGIFVSALSRFIHVVYYARDM